jgi:hypothetical protein
LSALLIGLTLPNVWLPLGGVLPIRVTFHYDIASVTPGVATDVTGLHVGDRVEPQSTNGAVRLAFLNQYFPKPGETLSFRAHRSSDDRDVVVRESYQGTVGSGLALVKRTTASLFIIVAAILLLMRPSPMLWGFFLYALGSTNGGPLILEFVNPTVMLAGTMLIQGFFYNIAGAIGLIVFATRFPAASKSGLRRFVERITPVLGGILFVATLPYALFLLGAILPPNIEAIARGVIIAVTTLGILSLLTGLVELEPAQRQRLRWVVAGFSVFYATQIYQQVAPYLPAQGWPSVWTNAGWTDDVLNVVVILIPMTMAYAALKHHVLDLNFVFGRGLVYGILTSIAVATFAIVEWLLTGVLSQTKLAATGEVIAAIAIGFWLNSLHGQVNRFVDAVIFRKRYLAERRLTGVAAGLPHAQTYDTVAMMLVCEPVEALGLASAALFRRVEGGRFRCERAVGVSNPPDITVLDGDALSVRLHGERGPISLHHIGRWSENATADRSFFVALPVFVRRELVAIVFYGGHETGEAIDPDEMRTLQSLCVAASAALDHLEAMDLRNRLDESERTNQALRSVLESATR